MKAILTGATGLIGSEALTQCLKNDQIDSLIILSRRAIPHLDGNPKVKVMLMNDFTKYPDEVLGQLEGADIGIW
jgi:NAD dependent epimerase/dehydratase family enzyme